MISREDLSDSELLEKYQEQGYKNYRRFLAVRAQLEKRKEMAPTNAESYDKILGRVGADYAKKATNLKRNAVAMIKKEAERVAVAMADAEANWWERLRKTVDQGSGASAQLLADRVRNADWDEIERLFSEGDKWAKSVIAMTVDEPVGEGKGTYEHIMETVKGEHQDPRMEELEQRAHEIKVAKRHLPMLDPLAYAKAQDEALDGEAGIHEQALRAEPSDFGFYERHSAAETITHNWELISASLPSDWEAKAEAEAAS